MSNLILNRVWKDETVKAARPRLTLVALADQANDDGICWPGNNSICQRTSSSKPTSLKAINELEHLKAIEVFESHSSGKRRDSNHYLIKIGMTDDEYKKARARLEKMGLDTPREPKAAKKKTSSVFHQKENDSKDGFTANSKDGFTANSKDGFTPPVKTGLPDPSMNPHSNPKQNLSSPDGETDAPSDEPSPVKQLETAFGNITRIKLPDTSHLKNKKAKDKANRGYAKTWWQPLGRILRQADGDVNLAKTAVSRAYHQLKGYKGKNGKRMVIHAPCSVEKTAISILADMKANSGVTNNADNPMLMRGSSGQNGRHPMVGGNGSNGSARAFKI